MPKGTFRSTLKAAQRGPLGGHRLRDLDGRSCREQT